MRNASTKGHAIRDTHNRSRRELLKRLRHQLPQPPNRLSRAPSLDLAVLRHEHRLPLPHERSVEGIDQAVFDQQRTGQDQSQRAAFAEHEQRGGDGGQRARGEEEDGELREVGEAARVVSMRV